MLLGLLIHALQLNFIKVKTVTAPLLQKFILLFVSLAVQGAQKNHPSLLLLLLVKSNFLKVLNYILPPQNAIFLRF